MARYVLSTASALLVALLALLVGGRGEPRLAIVEGNYDFARGDLVRATQHYRRAAASESRYLAYNMGNAYLDLGEIDAGVERLLYASRSADPELRWRAAFNLGHAHYQAGRYAEAALHFRDALLIAPKSSDAKVNLELALRRVARPPSTPARPTAAMADGGADPDFLQLLRDRQPAPVPALPAASSDGGY